MIHVRLTSRAYNDLTSITSYLTEHAPGAAPAVMLRIEQTLEHIAHFPLLGRTGRRANTREVVVSQLPFLIVY